MEDPIYSIIKDNLIENKYNSITIENLKIGDTIAVMPKSGYGGHLAYITITKINKATITGTEQPTSYKAGTNWNIHKKSSFAIIYHEKGYHPEDKNQIVDYMRLKWFNQK
jgi:hypothetical protein